MQTESSVFDNTTVYLSAGRLGHRDVDSMGFAYDYWSIMHYGPKAYSWNKKETIRIRKVGRKVGAVIGMRELSKLDIAQIRAMYQCNPVPSIESRKGRASDIIIHIVIDIFEIFSTDD